MANGDRRSFLQIATACIGGILSFAAGIPLIGFAISPAWKKGESKWVDLGLVDRLKNSRYKKVKLYLHRERWMGQNYKKNVLFT